MSTSQPFSSKTTGSSVAELFASSIKGKTIVITGVNKDGLGGKTAEVLSSHGPKILVLASRTIAKVQGIIDQLQPQHPETTYIALPLDLSSQKSCREAAAKIVDNPQIEQIDVLINNAGIMRLPERQLSSEGIELQFATNHIGHFLFTNLLMPKILAAAKVNPRGATRIINVSSSSTFDSPVRFSDVNFERAHETLPTEEQPNYAYLAGQGITIDPKTAYDPSVAYGQSKTANILFSLGLTSRMYDEYGILSFAIHPGVIPTELARSLPEEVLKQLREAIFTGPFKDMLKSLDQGCATTLVAGLDPTLGPAAKDTAKGVFLEDGHVSEAPAWAQNWANAEILWRLSESLVSGKSRL